MYAKSTIVTLFALATTITATLDPATSHSNNTIPASPECSPAKISKAIQAAECSHNTRVSGKQTFAIFTIDHQYDKSHGAPYGTCEAYTCALGSKMKEAKDTWTFFWDAAGVEGENKGEGMGCIRSPKNGNCGCESSSDGKFIEGKTDCV
ncbi:small secreted protein [Stemphylium lycopersici]|uniref:Small secreted protein n=1 Tax=Stemphylium lycopersici TaxID=183478 RepID=A0A364NEV7_STELY|nr:small secreted protein [Stemphylium lycopersici]RAR15800.1 small secreted protein [Stemphylium lycopersici]